MLNQRDAAYYLWTDDAELAQVHKALACQLVGTCGATTNPFEVEDEAALLAAYIDRGVGFARERPYVVLTTTATLGGYDMEKERYPVRLASRLTPGSDSYRWEGDELVHTMESPIIREDAIRKHTDVSLVLDSRADSVRLDLKVPKSLARAIEDGFGVFADRELKVAIYAQVTEVSTDRREVSLEPIRMVGQTINWPDDPVPVFDSSWEMLAPKPMNDVEQMLEIGVEENLR